MVLIGKMYEMKKVINIVLLVLLIILVTFSLAGLIYSIFYECKGYMINCLPDVGTPADFCGAAGTTLAVVFTWQQIKDSASALTLRFFVRSPPHISHLALFPHLSSDTNRLYQNTFLLIQSPATH